jgi:hypothetical protein
MRIEQAGAHIIFSIRKGPPRLAWALNSNRIFEE